MLNFLFILLLSVLLTGGDCSNVKSEEIEECTSEYTMGSGEMFNSIAPKYDIINKFMSLGLDQSWRRQLVESIELKPTDRVLDLATGTADVAILIGKALSEKQGSGKVIGIDPSANMIGIGDDKVGNEGLAEVVTLQLGDAQDLNEIPSHSFDKVTMSFGIRNVPDREAALKEIYRVLVKSSESRVSIMEFHQPSAGVLALVARFFIKSVTPLIGWFMSGNFAEYDHLEKSIFAFPSVEEWSRLMESCGFEMIESKNACMDTVYIHTAKPKSG